MLKIVKYPDPILLQENQSVEFPLNQTTKDLIKNMWDTVQGMGIGLAAPQVGANLKICIVHMAKEGKNQKNQYKNKEQDFVMINPEIIFYSESEVLMAEGCLSFPGQFYEIWRPQGVKVRYFDEKGRVKEKAVSGLLARVIQHEVDHLNGKLFINMGGKKIIEDDLPEDAMID
jgi:peptide deformylase